MSRLLPPKELAFELRRHVNYVYAMRADGFKMPGGMATLEEARAWLDLHPHPKRKKWRRPDKTAATRQNPP